MNCYRNEDRYHGINIFAVTIKEALVSVTQPIQENSWKIVHNVVVSDFYDLFVLPNVVDYVSAVIECNENQDVANYGDNYATI